MTAVPTTARGLFVPKCVGGRAQVHFHDQSGLLGVRSMSRWTNFIGALLLVLVLWTGTSAHAAERFDCIPVTEQSAEHFEGDRDEAPDDPDDAVTHHHTGCNGHCVATPGDPAASGFSIRTAKLASARQTARRAGREPESQLRPPIA